ncbi:MAG TPA: glycosyltransferase, partial [Gammaproteobacteria bacterium]|nr:glycosyltransferase [Gammaproteobacteria bacterium]
NRILKKKINHWDNIDLTLVSPSHWLANCARESSVFRHNRIEVIPNGIDTDKYRPIEKKYARRQLGLPLEKNLILFGAQRATGDSRKGFDLLEEAVTRLSTENHQHRTEIVIYGTNNKSKIEKNNIKRHYIGKIDNEKKLVTLYSAADVFVAPSRQDNLPNTVMEALACGTACAAFDIGGMPDMIEHKKNGYLATPYDPADLANGIRWVLSDADRLDRLEHAARKKVLDEFDINLISKRYIDLYQSCLAP